MIRADLNRRAGFTLMELIISVALLIIALSVALFAVIGTSGLIQKTEARGAISEGSRSVGEMVRRTVDNAPIGAVSLLAQNPDGVSSAAIRVRDFSTIASGLVCTTIGRVTITLDNGEETYAVNAAGDTVSLLIHRVDSGGLCPLVTSTPIYQNRLTSAAVDVTDLSFSLQTLACQTQTASCQTKQFLRYTMTLEQKTKSSGGTEESRKPTLSISDGLAVGLVNEATTVLAVATGSLASGVTGTAYSDTLTASGGIPNYTWALVSGAGTLPAGLSLDSNSGAITGTPSTAGTANFRVRVTDSVGATATKDLSITISSPPSGVVINTSSPLTTGQEGALYTVALSASGGTGPYTWAVTAGTLPAGLSLVPGTGVISGVPLGGSAGDYSFTIQATDTSGAKGTKTFALHINAGGGGPPGPPVIP